MSADILRRAASLMRERAEVATAGVCPEWTASAVRHIARNCEIECYQHDECETWSRYDDAAHIASWHPAVALAVAAWLDAESQSHIHLPGSDRTRPIHDMPGMDTSPAALVARAYLGGDS